MAGGWIRALSEVPQRKVLVEERKFQVSRTGSRRFQTVRSVAGGEGTVGAAGHGVVQFRDLQTQKCVAAVVDGEVHACGWK